MHRKNHLHFILIAGHYNAYGMWLENDFKMTLKDRRASAPRQNVLFGSKTETLLVEPSTVFTLPPANPRFNQYTTQATVMNVTLNSAHHTVTMHCVVDARTRCVAVILTMHWFTPTVSIIFFVLTRNKNNQHNSQEKKNCWVVVRQALVCNIR